MLLNECHLIRMRIRNFISMLMRISVVVHDSRTNTSNGISVGKTPRNSTSNISSSSTNGTSQH